jgi:magnesium chelatase subunit D
MSAVFPFSAIVGQEALKRALLLGIIQPALGGVLIRGTKGVAKSTAVRALARLLPPIETIAGCPFQRRPGEVVAGWPLPGDAAIIQRPVPLIELPLGATEDRVLGALHLEKALHGQRAFEPGLLAAANRGILYIDEVNLLPDHLVDILLDAAASGVHRLEREGLSLAHPARFMLVGTMNPEEGDLRPQLLDRFGLAVDVVDLSDPAERAEAVRRRLAFEADADTFAAGWQAADVAVAERVMQARRLLPEVTIDDDLLQHISERCLAAGVEGLRADLTLCQAACAWAAYEGRRVVAASDIDTVAELALAHRRGEPPPPPPGPGSRSQESEVSSQNGKAEAPSPASGGGHTFGDASIKEQTMLREDIAGVFAARVQPPRLALSLLPGRWRGRAGQCRGPIVGQADNEHRASLAWGPTLRTAAPFQKERGRRESDSAIILRTMDLRFWRRREPAGRLLFFVVDTSGSMAAWRRMRQTKAAILALLLQAYQHRDRVALLAFHGSDAELVLPPTTSLRMARRALADLPTGGTTPLAHGLAAARRFIQRQPHWPTWTVFFTDGRTNVPMMSHDPWEDAVAQARALRDCGTDCLVVDTETGWPRFGRARALAKVLGADCLLLEEVLDRPLSGIRREIAS